MAPKGRSQRNIWSWGASGRAHFLHARWLRGHRLGHPEHHIRRNYGFPGEDLQLCLGDESPFRQGHHGKVRVGHCAGFQTSAPCIPSRIPPSRRLRRGREPPVSLLRRDGNGEGNDLPRHEGDDNLRPRLPGLGLANTAPPRVHALALPQQWARGWGGVQESGGGRLNAMVLHNKQRPLGAVQRVWLLTLRSLATNPRNRSRRLQQRIRACNM